MAVPEEILALHLAELEQLGRSQGTIYARRRAITRMAALIEAPLLEATAEEIAQWRAGLRVTDNTAVHYASHARAFFAWALRRGLVDADPAAGLLVPPLARGLPRPISEDDLMLALLRAPARIRPWLVLAAWQGLRAKEIALLRRENVLDTTAPPVLIIARGATKGRRERIVPLSSFTVAELRAAGLPRSGWIFPRLDGKPLPNTPARVSQAANRYLHSVGVDATLHQLRHRFGTAAYAQSRDLRLVQELMGHSRPESTAGYTAYNQADAVELVEALPAPGRLRVIGALAVSRKNKKGGLTSAFARFTGSRGSHQ
jgi:integrase